MKQFEKNLKKLLDIYQQNGEASFSNYLVNLSLSELDFLQAKGFISYMNFHNSNGIIITLKQPSFTYFHDRKDKKRIEYRDTRRYWITTAIAILALVLAAISLAAQLGLIKLPTTSLPM